MGLTTQYLRYVSSSVFGVIGKAGCVRFVTRFSQQGKYVAVPACEQVLIWDTKRGAKALTLNADVQGVVTVVEPRPPHRGSLDNTHVAVGYSDGSVVIFDLTVGQPLKFAGHHSAISSLTWDPQGMRVASGSNDGEIVVWDVVSERGVVRLKGHKGRITRLRFLQHRSVVVSSCIDSFIKFWDIETHHCFRTLSGHRAEVRDFVLLKNDTKLVAGSLDAELRVWSLRFSDLDKKLGDAVAKIKLEQEDESYEPPDKLPHLDAEGGATMPTVDEENEIKDDASILEIVKMGSILRSQGDKVCGLLTDGHVVACYGTKSSVDMFSVLTDEEVEVKIAKRLKKQRKRARETGEEFEEDATPKLVDEIKTLPPIRACNKLLAVDAFLDKTGIVKLVTLHVDNSLAIYQKSLDPKDDASEQTGFKGKSEPTILLDQPGHRTLVSAVAFSSLSDQIISASGDSLKVWHRADTQAIATIACDYALSLVIAPGDRHAVIGTRSGRIQLFDIVSSAMLEDILAHESDETETDTGVWSIALTHDGRGFVSGGSDKMVKFWKFELVRDELEGRGKRLSFMQDDRALKVADQVTCVRCSSDGKFVAVATLDLKETLYFMDTLKLCHELYGKSLPATCMDFSTDGTLLVTGSKDARLRLYGTDYGDQRRLFKNAHQGGVTDCRFISKTHLFFSCGHDGTVKQWDADNFQRIITLQGHSGIVRCLAVCPKGAWVATSGQDRSLRLWQRTNEPLILEDEREEERRREEEEQGGNLVTQRPVIVGENVSQAVRPSTTTHHTEKAVDMIIEALIIYREQLEGGPSVAPNQLMTVVYKTSDPLKFVLEVLRKVKSSELEEAIIMLSLDRILELLVVLKSILERGWEVELAGRILVLACRINLSQLLASAKAAPIIHALAKLLPEKLNELKDMVGFNLAGLRHLADRMEQRSEDQMFAEATMKVKSKQQKKKKRDRAIKRVLMTI
ncbi:WD repeat-containing protein 3 [Palaemon carinicauda]|uniref:WD repeat-containing protein 3 n=1 Tax=Palaemon carinicauda TaxID=392227 RepID=UPI0035B596D7